MSKVDLLAILVGNTRVQLGAFVGGKLVGSSSQVWGDVASLTQAVREMATLLADQADRYAVLMASVNPQGTQAVLGAVKQSIQQPVLRVEKDMPIPIGRQLDRESIVGEDRLLTAAAAYDTLKQTCMIVDAGTAMTVDLVDGQGTFHGGAICPGANTMLQSLHGHTAQLPAVPFAVPEEPLGHNTTEAMRSGVFYGLRGAVRELVEQYAEAIGTYPMVIATGGDAHTLFDGYDLVERIIPELGLYGLRLTYETYLQQKEDE